MRVGVLASGEGTNLQALLDTVHGHEVEIVAVGSDRPAANALDRAGRAGVPVEVFSLAAYASARAPSGDREQRDRAMADWLDGHGVELVVLAGYMALLHAAFTDRFAGRLVNVHPALLPAFPGVRAIDQALAYGVKVFGVTVHLVDAGVDTGPVLLQRAVALPDARAVDEVHDALRPVEHELLCQAVRAFAAGEVRPDPGHPRRMVVG